MLDIKEAENILKKSLPGAEIIKEIEHENLYIFYIARPHLYEEDMDPFFSVDKHTGEVSDYSIITDSTPEVISKFQTADIKTLRR